MVSAPIEPLDVSNITKTWPPWKQSFQIYITANYGDVLPDRRKLALFLYCLGPAGLAMANKMFPQLIDFDSAAAKQVRFVNIWNKFNSKAVSKKQMVQRSMVELLRGICPCCFKKSKTPETKPGTQKSPEKPIPSDNSSE